MPDEILYFVHISDTHIGPTPDYALRGHVPLPAARRLVAIINSLPVTPDFVMHTGDVVTNPDPDSYALAAETLSQIGVPIYYATGNHDTSADVHKYMALGPKEDATADPATLSYAFECKGYRFLVLDGRGPDAIDPQGQLTQAQLDFVRREATPEGPPLTIFCHFPALPFNSTWMDENLLLTNGEELHQILRPARDRLRAFFYGHIHQSVQTVRDGILYVSAASAVTQISGWPGAATPEADLDQPPAYNFVHLTPDQTIIHQHTFPRPVSA